ncbi:uncharacterized protein STEHIDRAFT_162252 [Stereum hirsutum FP-91666 SS1]|uniref:uncharacterized protein n=1 Tax=Stereum hirsutum (strain FP-91666) TaxID=721885 RepID=UPI00044491F0|nr:uncharacterized protein STEHIDRAFT_162252 [Stereum hirsutum FP-91666 SS1]EIM81272.1 hypothetical protein STEHIDRAFT_162252 [Stereum hirsutum FP-91666 SS1]
MQSNAKSDSINQPMGNPPAYEYVAGSSSQAPLGKPSEAKSYMPPPPPPPQAQSYGATVPGHSTTVYHYQDPRTGQQISSLLPPDAPAMICLQQGEHIAQTQYGILGVLAAVIWFPVGIACCLLDRKVKCKRCGEIISSGIVD